MTVESSVPVGSTGDALRTFAQNTSEGLVQTEAVALADTTDTTQVARVKSEAPASDDAGLVVRVAGDISDPASASASTVLGNVNDAAVTSNTTGTISAKLRGLTAILGSAWDSLKGLINVRTYVGDFPVSGTNPVPVTGTLTTTGATLNIVSAVSTTDFNIGGGVYSATSAISGPYKLNSIKFKFSTAAAKTITVTDATTGTIIAQPVSTTATDYVLPLGGIGFPDGRQFAIDVTQASGPCLMTLEADIENGQLPMGGNPSLAESTADIGKVGLSDGPNLDAFGRLRVSNPFVLFDNQFQYGIDALTWDQITASGGTITNSTNSSCAILNTTTASGSRAVLQTHQYYRYQPGKSQFIQMTWVFGAAVANLIRRAGYFDDNNGLFTEQNGTTDLAFVVRSSTSGSPVDTRVAQADWNIDTLDGTGGSSNPSGILLDITKAQLLVIDFQWLSVGRVRFGFEIGGQIIYCHQNVAANVATGPYMTTANLPLRYEAINAAATAGANTTTAICQAVYSEGGAIVPAYVRATNSGTTAKTVGGTRVPILSIRPKLTFGGVTNRGQVIPASITAKSSSDLLVEVWYRPTLTGAAFTSVDSMSIAEYDSTATAVSVTNAYCVFAEYLPAGQSAALSQVSLEKAVAVLDAAGTTQDIVSITAISLSGNASVFATMQWQEYK